MKKNTTNYVSLVLKNPLCIKGLATIENYKLKEKKNTNQDLQVQKTCPAIRGFQLEQMKLKREKNYKLGLASLKNMLCNKGLTTMTNYKLKEKKSHKLGLASPKNLHSNKELLT